VRRDMRGGACSTAVVKSTKVSRPIPEGMFASQGVVFVKTYMNEPSRVVNVFLQTKELFSKTARIFSAVKAIIGGEASRYWRAR